MSRTVPCAALGAVGLALAALAADPAAATPGGSAGGGMTSLLVNIAPLIFIFVIFYFLLIRPQQKRMKEHRDMVANLRRGDVVVTAGGLIGKVTRVADDELTIELGEGEAKVRVRVVRSTISAVRSKTEPVPANDSGAESEA